MLALSAASALAEDSGHEGHAAGGELKHGRYTGFIKLDDRNEKFAVESNFYLEAPDNADEFPRLNAIFKLNFGGYNTHEYMTEIFENIQYDFDFGQLTLDEPDNDLTMTAEVHAISSGTFVMGQVFIRSSGVSGTINLKWESDEPGGGDDEPGEDPTPPVVDNAPFIPAFDGQYIGQCEGRRAALQIQTMRGLNSPEARASVGFDSHYLIGGRIAYDDPQMCDAANGQPAWCRYYNFGSGTFNPYLGKATFTGARSTQECQVRQGKVSCRVRNQGRSVDCAFQKQDMTIAPVKFFPRKYFSSPTTEQLADLPSPNPPRNEQLTIALRGMFSGWVHNETNDTYQFVQLNVMPFSSTDNPHNVNQVSVSTTLMSHFGPASGGNFTAQRFEPRAFYFRPGFTLRGAGSDSFINISEWKTGYIRGDFFSHEFGRVGSIQLLKGVVPALPAAAKIVGDFSGEFEGVNGIGTSHPSTRWLKLVFPTQISNFRGNMLVFKGSFQSIVNVTALQNIDEGVFDPYSGVLGWIMERDGESAFASGRIGEDKNLMVYWPPRADLFGASVNNYKLELFSRTEE